MLAVLVLALPSPSRAGHPAAQRERSLDSQWLFVRHDAPGADLPEFDDGAWRTVDLPHDWSLEDLAPSGQSAPVVSVVEGTWRFRPGDDPAWNGRGLSDLGWKEIVLPAVWQQPPAPGTNQGFGWYRRHLLLPSRAEQLGVDLLLGKIGDADEAFLNGVRIGGSGSFPPEFKGARETERSYHAPPGLAHGDGTDLLAVRVFGGLADGGILAAGHTIDRVGPFDPAASQGGESTGHVVGGTGWYRRHFRLGPDEAGRIVAVRFDGVYMDADVWINGHPLGNHPYGYTGFSFDLTTHLRPPGEENVLSVRVRNEGKNSRWYSGSGIYRHVWLTVTDPLRVGLWGVTVTTPKVSAASAEAVVAVAVENDRPGEASFVVQTRILGPGDHEVRSAETPLHLAAGAKGGAEQIIPIPSPKLWSPDAPGLYRAEARLIESGRIVDQAEARFGIRSIEIDATNGFRLNGTLLKLKGGCVHHDNGPLGAAAIDRAEERRVELLKASGFNAIRTSHNPPSPAFLDACDRLGMLVIDEAFDQWEAEKNPADYHRFFAEWWQRDLAAMVRRDRNHPSVVIWSIGNEIHERFDRPELAAKLRDEVRRWDTTRPVTAAICEPWDWPGKKWEDISAPAFENLDLGGYNYLPHKFESDHARFPNRVMVATETFPTDAFNGWSKVQSLPYVIGDFVWTAMDYLGESGIGHALLDNEKNSQLMPWPWFDAWCGDLDICGFKKAQSYYRDVVWGRAGLAIGVHTPLPPGRSEKVSAWGWPEELDTWTWTAPRGQPLMVNVYTRCEKVRLELNGKKVDEKLVSASTRLTARFEVPYVPGTLRAIGYINGKEAASLVLRSAGPPKKLRLTVDRPEIHADRNDLAYVTVEVVDSSGIRDTTANPEVRFKIEGEGELAATGNGNPADPASFHLPERRMFHGRGLAILRPTGTPGKITLKAEADGLSSATVTVHTR